MKLLCIFILTFISLRISAAPEEEKVTIEKNGPCIKVVEKVSDSKNLKPMITFISQYNERFWPYLEKLKDQKKVSEKEYFSLKEKKKQLAPMPRGFNFKANDEGGAGTGGGVVVEY